MITCYGMFIKLRKVVGTDIFMINNENLLIIVDYYIILPVIKNVESMLAKDLI